MRTPALRMDSTLRFRFALGLGLAAALLLVAPLAARAGEHRSSTRTNATWFDFGNDDHFGWSLYDPKEGNVTGSTDGDDWQDIHRSLDDETTTVFWFKIDGDRYVVRDPEIVARVQEITEPIRELGKKQGELGARQGALGAQQGKLGAEQGRLGARQARLTTMLVRLSADGDEDREERRAIQRELDRISARMGELGEQQGELGAKQGPLGAEQGELGRQQNELSKKATVDLRKIADEALRNGKAQRLGGRRHSTI